MLVKSSYFNGELRLEVYSFDVEEFAAVEEVLLKAGAKFRSGDGNSRDKRQIKLYYVAPESIVDLGRSLGGTFDKGGSFVADTKPAGSMYACEEVSLRGKGDGCEEFVALGQAQAQMACGLIASKKRWFGGVSRPGACSRGAR